MKRELDTLVSIAGDDKSIGDGVESYALETIQNMITMIETSLDRLPHRMKRKRAAVSVEVAGDQGERLYVESPRATRTRTGEPASTS